MKRALVYSILVGYVGLSMALALTPAERKTVQHARTELTTAQKDYTDAKTALAAADQRAQDAELHAQATDQFAGTLQKQVDTEHTEAQRLANLNAKMKPVYDQCTKWLSLGAFVYGFKELIKHLLILAAVGVGLMALVYGLSFAFPVFGAILAFIHSILSKVLAVIESRIKKV
jgi:ABC-type multidrug transport system fused ATPase/permease subunit